MTVATRLKHAWNTFMNRDSYVSRMPIGPSYGYRPDRPLFSRGNERSIITSVYNRIALDVSSMTVQHVRLDGSDRFKEVIESGLNNCLTVEANVDQTGRAFMQDIVMSMLDEGCVAIIPVDTNFDPEKTGGIDIETMRTGKILEWFPQHVKVRVYNDQRGEKEDILVPKSTVGIVENPFYAVMNEPNSTMQRLIRKLNLLDAIDEQNSSGKLNLIIQLPYVIKTEARRQQAELRRQDIENQLASSKYGVAYTDGTEHVVQLNRPVENNLMSQIEYLTSMLYSQLGLTQGILDGSADDMKLYAEQHNDTLKHGIDDIEALFPEYKDLRTGAPELITRDQGWVNVVMNKVHKSPISRIRTRNMDARGDDIRAHGYQKGKKKVPSGNMKLMKRTTDPQTIYITDSMHRDDIIDITDFDVVEYQYGVMRQTLLEEVATAILIGDGRDEADEHKISEEHVRSIWNDDDLYTIHYDVDIEAARNELQGTGTASRFGENYIYAEAIITAALYSREKFKGTGTPDFFCTPHLVNVMLLARDTNGRRIYNSKADLAAALNINELHTAEQFEGLARTDKTGKKHNLLGIFVNLSDYTVGSTKGGEITRFNQFDIDFNQEKYLIETRLSGALTRLWSAIALEEPVKASSGQTEDAGHDGI